MIPIRDTNRSENYPLVNNSIIALNVLVFIIELSQGQQLNEFLYIYGLVPARYSVQHISALFTTGQQIASLFTFMFLHGGFLHLLGNMWFLYIFGDNIEDRLGHIRYLAFYLLCGWASGISHLAINWHAEVPTIGASGAIAGIMGAYLILYPRAKVLTLVPIFFLPYFIELPAFFFLGAWFLFQFLSAAISPGQTGGIAWWAHIGGFVCGIIFLKLFELLPKTGMSEKIRRLTRKRREPRLQLIRPIVQYDDPDLYGSIVLSKREAHSGVRKLIAVAYDHEKRALFVSVPPSASEGSTLRLKGLGRQTAAGEKGDLYLKVQIKE